GILNDPMTQSRTGPKPLKGMDSIPVVPPSFIKKVKDLEFDPYRKLLSDVYDKYQYNRALGLSLALEGMPVLSVEEESEANTFAKLEEITEKLGIGGSSWKQKDKRYRIKLQSNNAPDLDTVPKVFFDSDFQLGNPHIFDLVCQNTDVTSTNSSDAAMVNDLLQEKLSQHLETVEVHLLKEISRRSSSFFAALTTLKNLHQETLDCVTQIQGLREKLTNVNKSNAKKGLDVVRLKRRRGNLGLLYGSIKLVAEIKQTQPMIQILLSQGDYIAALDLIENTGDVLKGKGSDTVEDQANHITTETLPNGVVFIRNTSIIPRSLDLRGVRSLQNLNSQLSEMYMLVGKMMEGDLVNLMIGDIRDTVGQIDKSTMLASGIQKAPAAVWIRNIVSGKYSLSAGTPTAPSSLTSISDEDKLKRRLTPLVMGLLRIDRLSSALQSYKDALISEIKILIKRVSSMGVVGLVKSKFYINHTALPTCSANN
ncbi:hypothetical protein HK096_007896, partial [Nowakowskiella sp. JEL0078]